MVLIVVYMYTSLYQCSMYGLTVVISAWGNALTHAPDERSSLYSIDAMSDLIGYFVGVILTSICTESTGAIILAFIFLVENYLLVKYEIIILIVFYLAFEMKRLHSWTPL